MSGAVERIVVQATRREKQAIAAKARRHGLPISELMRRGASAYEPPGDVQELGALADAARLPAERAGAAIDDALTAVSWRLRFSAPPSPVERAAALPGREGCCLRRL
jgi:hypothetical protein